VTIQHFGAHLSIAGGVHHALESAGDLGCNCLQIFVKNQRQWSAPPLDPSEIERWSEARRRTGVGPVFAHATYLINLASPDRTIFRRSIDACADELGRCALLGIDALILHPGSHRATSLETGISRVVTAIDRLTDQPAAGTVRIALETTAGQGDSVGGRFEHLAEIISQVRHPARLAVCVDTCHLFAAGYELRTPEGYDRTIDELDRHLGLARVCCIHANDSVGALGSHLDRHQHIGAGKLGLRAFRRLLNDGRLASVPRILETPKGLDPRGRDLDKLNLARLRRLVR
jgi:deoxyribonuclease IV